MPSKKRGKGKRRKNVVAEGRVHASLGTGKRNRNTRRCTHFEARTGKQCGRTVRVERGVVLCAMTIGTGTAMAARRGLWSSTIRGRDSKVAWEG